MTKTFGLFNATANNLNCHRTRLSELHSGICLQAFGGMNSVVGIVVATCIYGVSRSCKRKANLL